MDVKMDKTGTAHDMPFMTGPARRSYRFRAAIHRERHTNRVITSIQVSEPMVKAPSVTNAAKSLMKVSICISRVAIMFLYVRCLFLSRDSSGNSGDWKQVVSEVLGKVHGRLAQLVSCVRAVDSPIITP